MHSLAILRGCIAAWLLASACIAPGTAIPGISVLETVHWIASIGLLFAVPATLFALVGAWVAAVARLIVRWWAAPVGGAVAGGAAATWLWFTSGPMGLMPLGQTVLIAAFGAAAALVAWIGAFGLNAHVRFVLRRFDTT